MGALSIGELVGYLRISGTAAANRDLSGVQRSMDLTAGSAGRLGESVGQTETRLQGAGRAADTLTARSNKLRAAQLSALAAQERYNAVLADEGATSARLATAEATLIRAREQVTRLKPVTPPDPSAMQRFTSQAGTAVATAAKFGLALGGFELAMKSLEYAKSGTELTTALNGVAAASHASDQEMTQVRATSIALGKDLTVPKATAVDAADAINDLVKAGVSLDRAMVAARPALLLASAAQVDTADSARVLGDTLDDFHLKADQATHVANNLAAGANSAGGGLMDLFDGLKYAGPTARTLGLDVTTTTAALVELAKSGMQGSLGGTALMNMLTRLNPTAKTAKGALHDLGVEAFDSQGKFVGLPKVIDQLHAAQQRLNPEQFGQAVQVAFGTRAKNAVINFATGGSEAFDEFYKKIQAGDVQAYADKMNRGLSAAGSELRKEVTSWAIDLEGKAEPALTTTVFWIGEKLPDALSTAQHTLAPLEHEISDVLVPTVHGAAEVVSILVSALGEAGHIMDGQRSIVTGIGTAVLGMWAAYKGYQIAKTAVNAVSGALEAIHFRALLAEESLVNIGSAKSAIGGSTLALGALGLALGVAAFAWQRHQAEVQANKQAIKDMTSAIQQDNGVLGEHSRALVEDSLQSQGAFDAARKLGISLKTLTDAALGNPAALQAVADATSAVTKSSAQSSDAIIKQQASMQGSFLTGHVATQAQIDLGDAARSVTNAVSGQNTVIDKSVASIKTKAEADGVAADKVGQLADASNAAAQALVYTVDASGNLVQGQQQVGSSVNDTTQEMVQQKTAAELLKNALDTLNGVNLSVETTTDAFLDSLDQIKPTVDANAKAFGDAGTAMAQNTAEGRRNREQLTNLIQAAKDQAQATADSVAAQSDMTSGLKAGNAQLKANEDRIRAAAAASGLSKSAVDALIKSIGQLATVKASPTVSVNTSAAKAELAEFSRQIESVAGHAYQVVLSVKSNSDGAATGHINAVHKATGGLVDGAGTTTSDSIPAWLSRKEFVVNAAQTAKPGVLPLLYAINSGAIPGFAAGGLVGGGRNTRVTVAALPKASAGRAGAGSGSTAADKRAAADLQALSAAQSALRFSVTYTDLPKLAGAVGKTASAINTVMTKLINDVHTGTLHGLGSGALVKTLATENKQLQGYANQRATIAAKMASANQKLAQERSDAAAESAKVADKITSEFDIAGAGSTTNAFGVSAATPASIIATLTQQKVAARKFAAGLVALKAKGLGKDEVQQLGEDGVATAGASVAALQGASAAQIKVIDQLYTSTKTAANTAGGVVSRAMFQSGIDTVTGYLHGLGSQDTAVKKAASHLAGIVSGQIKKDLGIASPSKVTKGLGANAAGSMAPGMLSQVPKVAAAARSVAATVSKHLAVGAPSVAVRLPSGSKSVAVNDNRAADKTRGVVNHFTIYQLPNEDGAQLAARVGMFVSARSA